MDVGSCDLVGLPTDVEESIVFYHADVGGCKLAGIVYRCILSLYIFICHCISLYNGLYESSHVKFAPTRLVTATVPQIRIIYSIEYLNLVYSRIRTVANALLDYVTEFESNSNNIRMVFETLRGHDIGIRNISIVILQFACLATQMYKLK